MKIKIKQVYENELTRLPMVKTMRDLVDYKRDHKEFNVELIVRGGRVWLRRTTKI